LNQEVSGKKANTVHATDGGMERFSCRRFFWCAPLLTRAAAAKRKLACTGKAAGD
jgi:hypothetical protein